MMHLAVWEQQAAYDQGYKDCKSRKPPRSESPARYRKDPETNELWMREYGKGWMTAKREKLKARRRVRIN